MSDRFDFLEFGDPKPQAQTPVPEREQAGLGTAWKPLRLKAIELIGEQGTAAGQFSSPTGLAVDPWGALYVADSNNHRIQRIAPNGDVLIYGKPGQAAGELWGPQSIAVDPSGQFFYVAEQGNSRVQCFRNTGQPQQSIGGFRAPSGVTFDVEGMLWVADTGNGRVMRIDINRGKFLATLDRAAGILRPIALACDPSGNLYVTDGATNDVMLFTIRGVLLRSLGESRRLAEPRQVAADAKGRVYMAESGANRLHIFDAQNNSLLTFDTPSTRLGAFRAPSGVALGPNGEIYVADTLNHRILRLAWE